MTRTPLLIAATACLVLAAGSASAQSTAPEATPQSTSAPQDVAGGAAGRMAYADYVWHRTLAALGLESSGEVQPTPPARTALADNH